MKKLTLKTIAEVTGGEFIGDSARLDDVITDVQRDDRACRQGSLFLCFVGARTDGHDHAKKAFHRGAVCALCSKHLPDAKAPYILVPGVEDALRALAEYYRGLFDIPIVGITGSVGKTTAKEMTAAVLSEKYSVLKTQGNLNNEIGVPLTLLSLDDSYTAAVIEMGISDFGEMSRLAQMVRPNVCVMTTVGYCHLEALGDLDGVLRAKSEVFEYMDKDGVAVVSGDSGRLRAFDPGIKKVTFGFGENNDFMAQNVFTHGTESVECDIVYDGGCVHGVVPAFGAHIASSVALSCAVGSVLGCTDSQIEAGLKKYAAVAGRANVIKTEKLTIIDDCYNANPNSMRASIAALGELTVEEGRKVAILGDMKELGKLEKDLHYAIGVDTLEQGIDIVVCTGELSKEICRGNGNCAVWFPTVKDINGALMDILKPGDTVLVKASNSMGFSEIVEELKKLD